MHPIDPAELSALIDGELEDGRALEVQAAVDSDANLRHQYQALRAIDAQLRTVAETVALDPRVRLPVAASMARAPRSGCRWAFFPLAAVPVAWLVGKLTLHSLLAFAANAGALAVLIAVLVVLAPGEQWEGTRSRSARQTF